MVAPSRNVVYIHIKGQYYADFSHSFWKWKTLSTRSHVLISFVALQPVCKYPIEEYIFVVYPVICIIAASVQIIFELNLSDSVARLYKVLTNAAVSNHN
jgi:hypothetical protein